MGARMDRFGPGAALQYVAMLGVILAVVFGLIAAYFAAKGGYRPVLLGARQEAASKVDV
jgi:hypothetical protein